MFDRITDGIVRKDVDTLARRIGTAGQESHVEESATELMDVIRKYVLAGITCLLISAGLVWAGSWMARCGNLSDAWLCRVAERVGGAVLAPGLMTELYSGSKPFVLVSDTLFYAVIFFLISYFWMQRGNKIQ